MNHFKNKCIIDLLHCIHIGDENPGLSLLQDIPVYEGNQLLEIETEISRLQVDAIKEFLGKILTQWSTVMYINRLLLLHVSSALYSYAAY